MRHAATFALAVLLAAAAPRPFTSVEAAPGSHVTAGSVKVTLTYTGKGTVDGSHRIWVWLFDTPDIGPSSMPIAELTVDKNGGVAVFDGVVAEQVWIAAAYDERGVMSGAAPPPPGTPIGLYVGSDGLPRAVAVKDTADAVLTFDDSQRMP